jgi:hypothetical protein
MRYQVNKKKNQKKNELFLLTLIELILIFFIKK